VLSSQCLNRRIPDAAKLTTEVAAWQAYRTTHNAKANWHFTTADARIQAARTGVIGGEGRLPYGLPLSQSV
jgi:hypothetical protein